MLCATAGLACPAGWVVSLALAVLAAPGGWPGFRRRSRNAPLHCRIGDGDATARPVATRIGLIALTADGATVRSSDQFGVWSVICFMDTEINNEKIN